MSLSQLPASAENVHKILSLLESMLIQPTEINGKTYVFHDGELCVIVEIENGEKRLLPLLEYPLAVLVEECGKASEEEIFFASGSKILSQILKAQGEKGEINV